MKKIGVTGGIGSGKSIVSYLLKTMGVPVYIADDEAKKLTSSSPIIRSQLTKAFGKELFKDGNLDKPLFASLIFGNKNNLEEANRIIHPVVLADFLFWSEQRSHHPIVAMEAAILFESGFSRFVDITVNISAPLDLRMARVQKRDRSSLEDVMARISNQLSDEERSRLSDCVITNDGFQAIIPQVEKFLNAIYS